VTTPTASTNELRAIGYASGNLGKNLLWSAADLTLLFVFTDILGLSPSLAGMLMMLALAGDIAIDLAVGRIAAAAERYGIGYHHMLRVFAPLCGASFAALYLLAEAGERAFGAIVIALVAFRIFYGLVDIPHNAMMPHIASDSRARSRVAGYRYVFSSLATLVVTLSLAPQVSDAARTGQAASLGTFGLAAANCSIATLWLAAFCYRRPIRRSVPSKKLHILPQFSPDYVKLLMLGLLAGGASATFARSMIYYGSHYLSDPATAARILSALVVGQLAGTVLWSWASQRFETARVLATANALSACAVASVLLLPPAMQGVGGFAVGAALAGVFSLPWALLANLIDADDARSGDRREPQAVSLFVAALKAGAAIGIASMGWTLEAVGYHGAEDHSPEIASAVLAMAIGPAAVGGILAALIAYSLSTTHAAHARDVRRLIEQRRTALRYEHENGGDA